MTRSRTFALLGGLYVSQYLGIGFFYLAFVAILRDRGASLDQLAVVQLLGVLWAAKFLWAPVLDRYGQYRGWLLVVQPAIVAGLLVLTALDPGTEFWLLLALATLIVALSATQDIAADAIAVGTLDPADRGVGNGVQIAGGYLGTLIGGGLVLLVYDWLGWVPAIVVLAVCAAVPIGQVVRYQGQRKPAGPRPGFGAILSVFRVPGVARWALLVMPVLWIGVSAPYAMITPMLVDAGWSLSSIGLLVTAVAGVCALAAALGSGFLVRRLGRRRALVVFTGLQIVAVLGLLPLANGSGNAIVAGGAVCLMHAAYAATATVVNTVNMDLCRPASAGTDFSVLAGFAFLAAMIAGAVALNVAQAVGYPSVILGSIVLLVAGGALGWRVRTAPGLVPA